MNRSYLYKPGFTTAPSRGSQPAGRGFPAHPTYHGFCPVCCHPVHKCVCGIRECRKEAKELLVIPKEDQSKLKNTATLSFLHFVGMPGEPGKKESGKKETGEKGAEEKIGEEMAGLGAFVRNKEKLELLTRQATVGRGTAFIGGGCCVHLSIEFMSNTSATALPGLVLVMVVDSENTVLAWGKMTDGNDGYCIKEGIISTKPGAFLTVTAVNITARVRWCEVFSC